MPVPPRLSVCLHLANDVLLVADPTLTSFCLHSSFTSLRHIICRSRCQKLSRKPLAILAESVKCLSSAPPFPDIDIQLTPDTNCSHGELSDPANTTTRVDKRCLYCIEYEGLLFPPQHRSPLERLQSICPPLTKLICLPAESYHLLLGAANLSSKDSPPPSITPLNRVELLKSNLPPVLSLLPLLRMRSLLVVGLPS